MTTLLKLSSAAHADALDSKAPVNPSVRVTVVAGVPATIATSNGTSFTSPSQLLIDRATAIALAESLLIATGTLVDSAMAFLYHPADFDSVLRLGETVAPFDSTFIEPIQSETWLFWVDDELNAEWFHPSRFVFIDANGGSIWTREALSWPVVNGVELEGVPLPDSSAAWLEVVFGRTPPPQTVVVDYKERADGNADAWGIVIVGRNLGTTEEKIKEEKKSRQRDLKRALKILNQLDNGPRIKRANIRVKVGADTLGATKAEVVAAIESLNGKNCKQLWFVYVAHGSNGGRRGEENAGLILRKGATGEDSLKTEYMTYKELVTKLAATGAKEYKTVISACYSGLSCDHFKNQKKIKGPLVLSAKNNPSSRFAWLGSYMMLGIFDAYESGAGDLDGNGKTTLPEALVWARAAQPLVRRNGAQVKLLGDGRTIEPVAPPTSWLLGKNNADRAGSLKYFVRTVRYDVVSADGKKKVRHSRRILFVKNPSNTVHHPGTLLARQTDVNIYTATRRGAVRELLEAPAPTIPKARLKLVKGQQRGLFEYKGKQPKLRFISASAIQPRLPSFTAGNEDSSDVTVQLDGRDTYYEPGEFIFQEYELLGNPGTALVTSVDGPSSWSLTSDPVSFTFPSLYDTTHVVVRGDIPETEEFGDFVTLRIVNTIESDTLEFQIHAVLVHEAPLGILDGQTHLHQAVMSGGPIEVAGGTVELAHSVVRMQAPSVCVVHPGGTLTIRETAVHADSGGSYSFAVHGQLDWDTATLESPDDGLHLDGASGSLGFGGVFASLGDGLVVSGDQSGMNFNFFLVDSSATNGVVFDGTPNARLQHLTIQNSGLDDVLLRGSSSVVLLDSEFDANKTTVEAGSQLTRSWSTHIVVHDESLNPIPGAVVQVTDASQVVVATDTTDVDGVTNLHELVQYIEGEGGRVDFTPHTVTVRLGQLEVEQTFLADNEGAVEVLLTDQSVPVLLHDLRVSSVGNVVRLEWMLSGLGSAREMIRIFRASDSAGPYSPVSKSLPVRRKMTYEDGDAWGTATRWYRVVLEQHDGATIVLGSKHIDANQSDAIRTALTVPVFHNGSGVTVHYSVGTDSRGHTELTVFDVRGRKLRQLASGHHEPGHYVVTWNGQTDGGQRMARGIYLIRLEAGETILSRKVAVLD